MAKLGRGAQGVKLKTGTLLAGISSELGEIEHGAQGQLLAVIEPDGTLGWTNGRNLPLVPSFTHFTEFHDAPHDLSLSANQPLRVNDIGNAITISGVTTKTLDDVSNTNAIVNQVMKFDGSQWVPTSLTGSTTLAGMTDANLSGAQNGEIFTFNGSIWHGDDSFDGGTY
jgi:hypothetical protein